MITQNFLHELECALLRSFSRASRCSPSLPAETSNFLKETLSRSNFIQEFMKGFKERQSFLVSEIEKGGHLNSSQLLARLSQLVEKNLNSFLIAHPRPTETSFQRWIEDLKKEARALFYVPANP